MAHYTLTQIIVTIPEDLLCGRRDKRLIRVSHRRIFMDANPDFSGIGGLPEQERRSRILEVPQYCHRQGMKIYTIFDIFY